MAGEGVKFAADLTKLVQKAKGRTHLVVRKVALHLYQQAILTTPVDTGQARGGWMFSVGAPASGDTGVLDQAGTATVAALTSALPAAPAGLVLYLTNNVAHIRYLEYGPEIGAHGSPQAPQGMVRLAARNFADAVAKANASS